MFKTFRIILIVLVFSVLFIRVQGATVDEITSQINDHTKKIRDLEAEIARYQTELSKTSAQAKNLQSAVKELDTNSKKLSTDIKVTENNINSTNLTIQKLSLQILEKQRSIENNEYAIGNAIRSINETDSNSTLELILTSRNLSAVWGEVDTTNQFKAKVKDRLEEVKLLQKELLQNKLLTESKKKELLGFKEKLADQKTIVDINKNEKAKLLTQTKSAEYGYKQLISTQLAKKQAFEAELRDYESQLKFAIDPKSLPSEKPGVLAWPLAKHVITQYFGNTEFAQAHSQLYNGSGHNGIDLAAPIGTSVMSAGSGTVVGTGDTDTVCPGASYGKWVMVEHTNGLSTLYAHLSLIKVSKNQKVSVGDTVGYSGVTGYSTGPHLHFTVYASQGVRIVSRKSIACGGTYTMPVADLHAYLNPLLYL